MRYLVSCLENQLQETAGNTILHSTSFHPRPLVKFLTDDIYVLNATVQLMQTLYMSLKRRLLERGYSGRWLKKAFNRVISKNRHDLLFSHQKTTSNPNDYTRIITTCSNEHLKVNQTFNKYWHILASDPTIGPFVPPITLVMFRRTTSVGDLLVQRKFKGS